MMKSSQQKKMMDKIGANLQSIILLNILVLCLAQFTSMARASEQPELSKKDSGATISQPLQAEDAWSPETPPQIKTSAVYLKLKNLGKMPLTIIGVSSPSFSMAHIHRTITDNGLSSMKAVEHLTIPERQKAEFKPNAMHIMLMGAKKPHKAGDKIIINLKTKKGPGYQFSAIVKKLTFSTHDHSKMKRGN